jgi:Domain of unknown function (DUF4365)
MGWAFREQAAYDFGIGALAEECDDGYRTGRLIALVVKAGRSLFSEPDGDGWLYHGRNDELSYWLSYSLPVILLAHHPDTGLTYWQHFTPDAVTYTSKGWKIRIPSHHVLGRDTPQAFTAIAGGRRTSKYWMAAARTVARAEAITATPVSQPPQQDFLRWGRHPRGPLPARRRKRRHLADLVGRQAGKAARRADRPRSRRHNVDLAMRAR